MHNMQSPPELEHWVARLEGALGTPLDRQSVVGTVRGVYDACIISHLERRRQQTAAPFHSYTQPLSEVIYGDVLFYLTTESRASSHPLRQLREGFAGPEHVLLPADLLDYIAMEDDIDFSWRRIIAIGIDPAPARAYSVRVTDPSYPTRTALPPRGELLRLLGRR